jgi:hypothetical protein
MKTKWKDEERKAKKEEEMRERLMRTVSDIGKLRRRKK